MNSPKKPSCISLFEISRALHIRSAFLMEMLFHAVFTKIKCCEVPCLVMLHYLVSGKQAVGAVELMKDEQPCYP